MTEGQLAALDLVLNKIDEVLKKDAVARQVMSHIERRVVAYGVKTLREMLDKEEALVQVGEPVEQDPRIVALEFLASRLVEAKFETSFGGTEWVYHEKGSPQRLVDVAEQLKEQEAAYGQGN